jgi:hypothetical protein
VDGVSQRGPVLYWTLALAQMLFGRYEWVGIRVVGLVACLVTVLATYRAGAAARWPLAGAVGGAAVVAVIAVHGGTLGMCGEWMALPLLAGSLWAAASALRRGSPGRRRAALLALAGALAALAALAKQTLGAASGPLLLWALAQGWADEGPELRRALRAPAAFLAGWLGIGAAVVAFFAAHHALRELVYWTTTYNAEIYMAPYAGRVGAVIGHFLRIHLALSLGLVAAVAVVAGRAVRAREAGEGGLRAVAAAYARSGFELTAALEMLVTFLVALLPARFWWHYYMVVWPWVGLTAGVLLEAQLRRLGGRRAQAAVALALAGAVASAGAYRLSRIERARSHGAWGDPHENPACAAFDRLSRPGEPIFVWGFAGDLYINCRRPPAARFTYLTLVAGIVPPFWRQALPDRVARGSREALREDLERSRPRLIVDAPIRGFSIADVPELSPLLDRDYCLVEQVRAGGKRKPWIYVRREPQGTCPAAPARREPPEAATDDGEPPSDG